MTDWDDAMAKAADIEKEARKVVQSEIPEDIRAKAWELVHDTCLDTEPCHSQDGCGCFKAFARAIMDERERCAKIAEGKDRNVGWSQHEIAAAIRAPK